MNQERFNSFLYASAFSANLLSFCVGSAFSWASPVLPKLSTNNPDLNPLGIPITIFEESWIVSIMCLGSIIGSLISAPIAERLGRKRTLVLFSLTILSAHLMFAFGKTVNIYLLGRLILGFGVGCVYSVMPGYIGEISEDSNRGLLGCIMGLLIFIGGFFNYLVGPFVSIQMLSFLNLLPLCIFYPTALFLIPETPYYFLSNNNEAGAENSLRQLRTKPKEALKKELEYIKESMQEQSNNEGSFKDLFASKALVSGLLLTSGLFILQQLSGINAICAYMECIFEASQTSIPSHISAIVIGAIQVIANIFTTCLVDRLGRKLLLLISTIGTFISTLSLGTFFYLKSSNFTAFNINWLPIVSLIVFMIMYNLGIGPVSWVLMGEVFPSNVKSIASSISTCICLSTAFLVSLIFPYMKISLGMSGTFWIFSSSCAVSIIFVALKVPETKGVSLQDIQNILVGYKQNLTEDVENIGSSRTKR